MTIKNGRASTRLALSCPAAEAGGCKGTVALISSKPIKIGNRRVTVVIANASFNLRAGQRRNVTVRLPKDVRRFVKGRNLSVRVQTVSRDTAGNVATGARTVTLRLPAKR